MKPLRHFLGLLNPFVFIAVLLISIGGSAQKRGTQEVHKISVQTRLVKLTVVVRDKKGNPVTDLTQKDFSVFDDGHHQAISMFMPPQPPVTSTAAPLKLPPNTYTNLLRGSSSTPPSVTIIMFDLLNTPLTSQSYARGQLAKYLTQIRPQDHVALYALANKLTVVHDFTNNADDLLAALKLIQPGKEAFAYHPPTASSVLAPSGNSAVGQAMAQAAATANQFSSMFNEANEVHFTYLQVKKTLSAFDWIAGHVQSLPGRKNLIWLSGAFPFCFCFTNSNSLLSPLEQFYQDPIAQAAQRLENAGVAVYPVDARGLLAVDMHLVSRSQGLESPGSNISSGWNSFEVMDSLANWTGGVAFYNTNDIMHSIQRAVRDANASYVIGYDPTHHDWKGEFRKIEVKLDRKGLKADTRKGYFAVPENSENHGPAEDVFLKTAQSPFQETGIHITVGVNPVVANYLPQVDLSIGFDPKDIQSQLANGERTGNVEYGLVESDAAGTPLTKLTGSIPIRFSEAVYSQITDRHVGFTTRIPIDMEAKTLTVILRDSASGNLGSVRIPVEKYEPTGSN